MCKKALTLFLLFCFILCGCGKEVEEVVESTEPPLHEKMDSVVWDDFTIQSITPVCSFEIVGDELQIFPYYNNAAYINVVKILISDKAFWKTVSAEYESTDNYVKGDGWSLFTTSSGNSIAYIPIDGDEYAYVVSSSTLPSGYVKLVAEYLCNYAT